MRSSLLSVLALCAAAPFTVAQDCINLGTNLGVGDETVFPIQPIGFAFPLGGVTYTDCHVTTNGHLYLSNGGTPAPGGADYTATTAELASGPPRIAPLWSDFDMVAANNAGVYIENTSGTVCTITWLNATNYSFTNETPFTFQCKLYPNGDVEFLYGGGVRNRSATPAWSIGITGVSPGQGITLPASVDLSAGGAVTDTTLFEEFPLQDDFDMANDSLLLVAQSPGYAYVPAGPQGNCAAVQSYGAGCGLNQFASTYEVFPAGTTDLGGTVITGTDIGTGYLVQAAPSTGFPTIPVGAGAITLTLGDDMQLDTATVGGTLGVTVGSNGWLGLAGGNSNGFVPDPAVMLGNPAETVYTWTDLQPNAASSGPVFYEELGTLAVVTYDGVQLWGTTETAQIQLTYDTATGSWSIEYGLVTGAGPEEWLVGYSVAGASLDPGPTDLSATATTPLILGDTDVDSVLELAAGLPVLGANWDLTSTSVDAISPSAFVFFGDGQAPVPGGLPLQSVGINSPGCFAWINQVLGSISGPNVSGTAVASLPIPTTPALAGQVLTAQSVCLSTDFPSLIKSSNGIEGRLGY